MSGLFGVIVSGRPPVEFAAVTETEFACEIVDADSINHVVVFMTGAQPFPDNLGGSVYIRWPRPDGGENWHFLGFIANSKPSAIFKVAQLHQADARHSDVFGGGMSVSAHGSAQIGLMVEPLTSIEERHASESTQVSQQSTLVEFADKLMRNLINHTESFVIRLPNPNGNPPTQEYIPASAFQKKRLAWDAEGTCPVCALHEPGAVSCIIVPGPFFRWLKPALNQL
ncbi:unnamed protein product [Caenorhabditis auriculariae]|uniref:Hikeshi-like domain-containing protein n=1 Tax=Caenorhabditis auriculariae TaxID=2777116 RepID=A0A8S1HLM6_9PELO|nr:unnamed protein product [Caenorhabditis auriculariae]